MLEAIEIEPRGAAECAVIWLHGLGADGADFEPLVAQWRLGEELPVRFVLPHAPVRPVTLNGGMRMRAWYDIYDLSFDSTEDARGIEQARQQLLQLVERECDRGIDSRRILLAGFSQGGAVALHTAVRLEQPLAGVLALSTYLPLPERLANEKRGTTDEFAIRMDHGDEDEVVPLRAAELSCEHLRSAGFPVEFNHYPMGHSLCPEQADSLRAWILTLFR